jgi:hypothetical protein
VEQFSCDTFTDDLMAMGIRCTVGNARPMRNAPGRKTNMNDSHWSAQLHRSGPIKASFIPEDGIIKIGSEVSDLFSVAGLNVLRLLADGVPTSDTLAAKVTTNMTLAVGIIAEATNDVSRLADERKFAAWAGVAAGNNESALRYRIIEQPFYMALSFYLEGI